MNGKVIDQSLQIYMNMPKFSCGLASILCTLTKASK